MTTYLSGLLLLVGCSTGPGQRAWPAAAGSDLPSIGGGIDRRVTEARLLHTQAHHQAPLNTQCTYHCSIAVSGIRPATKESSSRITAQVCHGSGRGEGGNKMPYHSLSLARFQIAQG